MGYYTPHTAQRSFEAHQLHKLIFALGQCTTHQECNTIKQAITDTLGRLKADGNWRILLEKSKDGYSLLADALHSPFQSEGPIRPFDRKKAEWAIAELIQFAQEGTNDGSISKREFASLLTSEPKGYTLLQSATKYGCGRAFSMIADVLQKLHEENILPRTDYAHQLSHHRGGFTLIHDMLRHCDGNVNAYRVVADTIKAACKRGILTPQACIEQFISCSTGAYTPLMTAVHSGEHALAGAVLQDLTTILDNPQLQAQLCAHTDSGLNLFHLATHMTKDGRSPNPFIILMLQDALFDHCGNGQRFNNPEAKNKLLELGYTPSHYGTAAFAKQPDHPLWLKELLDLRTRPEDPTKNTPLTRA